MHNKHKSTNEHFIVNLEHFNVDTVQDSGIVFETSVRSPTLNIDLISEPLVGIEG